MNLFYNRWLLPAAFLTVGLLVGAWIGADRAYRWSYNHQLKYSEALEDHYIDSRRYDIATSIAGINAAERGNLELLREHQGTLLRGAFLTLIDLHRSGHYTKKDADIRKSLLQAKTFMEKRPKDFINQKLGSMTSIMNSINHPERKDDPEGDKATQQAREQLQEAFKYVESLQAQPVPAAKR